MQRFIEERGNEAVRLAVDAKNHRILDNTYDSDGNSALDLAIAKEDIHSIISLVSRDAYLDVKNINSGLTARQSINNNKDLHKKLEVEWIRRGIQRSFDDFLAAK